MISLSKKLFREELAFYNLFSINRNHARFIVHSLQIIAIFIFIIVAITIYWSSCLYLYISLRLFVTALIVFMFALPDFQIQRERQCVPCNTYTIVYVKRTNTTDNRIKSWHELVWSNHDFSPCFSIFVQNMLRFLFFCITND